MASILPDIRSRDGHPLVDQIATFYADLIREGSLRPGERLPTIREVAGHARVTRATVQQAYKRLADDGLVVATVGRGTMVRDREVADGERLEGPAGRFALDTWRHLRSMPDADLRADQGAELVADFAELRPDPQLFPVDDFRAAIEFELRGDGAELLAYGDPSGSLALREYLAASPDASDAPGRPEDILITSGAQQGIDLVVRSLTTPGAAVAAPIPTYHQLFGTLKAYGLRLAPVRMTADRAAIDLEDLRRVLARQDVELLYVMPTFHNPTGRTLDLEARQAVVDLAAEAGVPILEDEFECELRFEGDPLPSLRSLDARGWTSTVRSFSKGLFPGVRVGWVHAGSAVLGPLTAMKRFADLGTSPLIQASLARFIQRGDMARHLDAVRAELRTRHAVAQQTLQAHMPAGTKWTEPCGGFALWVELPPGTDADAVAKAAAERGVRVTPGSVFDPSGSSTAGLRLSLSRVSTEATREGIKILGAVAADACAAEVDTETQPPLYL